MRTILLFYTFFVSCSILVGDELKMKEVNELLYNAQNKILIIDKKDLDGFIAENNKKVQEEADAKAKEKLKAGVPEEIFLNLNVPTIVDNTPSPSPSQPAPPSIKSVQNVPMQHQAATASVPQTIEKPIEKKVFSVENIEKYKEFIALQNKSEYDVRYSLKLRELLEVTKYIFSKNLDKDYYPEIKSLLLAEAKNNKKIEKGIFIQSLNEMNYDVASEMLSELASLEEL